MPIQLNQQHPCWQHALKTAITDPAELLSILGLSLDLLPAARRAAQDFALRVPRSFVARMRRGDVNDPLLRQVLPIQSECEAVPGFAFDPLNETHTNPMAGLLHKYHGRVLLTVASGCAINCRYCFRRHFDYAANNPGRRGWEPVIDYIAADTSIREVILSGGDPLIATDAQLSELAQALVGIEHVQIIRFHTRVPIVIPERVNDDLVTWLENLNTNVVVIVHANHAQEINHEVVSAMQQLKNSGVTLLNQSVLLRGVNDSVEALHDLSESLFDAGVMPYYIHMLDKIAGAAHFAVDDTHAMAIHGELQARLPGYLVPKLVREEAGGSNKTILR